MDWLTLIASVTSSLGVSAAGAYWLAKTLVGHRLTLALEERKAEFAQQLDLQKALAAQDLERLKDALQLEQSKAKSLLDAEIRKQVEIQLGEVSAQRQYEYEARRRLYLAIGPLRFQLLLACRDLAGRVQSMGRSERYDFRLDGYYAKSTIYRILKPIALASLIEEQMTLNDFSVDREAIDLLRFRRMVTRIFSGDELVAGHPGVDWSQQAQHLYADSLNSVIQAIIERHQDDPDRVLRFDEFSEKIAAEGWGSFAPIDRQFDEFEKTHKPILWLRLVAYAHACNSLVTRQGVANGFREEALDLDSLLAQSQDPFIQGKLPQLRETMARMEARSL